MAKVDLVINFDDPYETESYFHRIGRTARFGRYGASFLLMSESKFSTFKEHKSYQFNIKELASIESLDKACESINLKLESQRSSMIPEEESQKPKLQLGDESLIGRWQDVGDENKYADIGQYRYAEIDDLAECDDELVSGSEEENFDVDDDHDELHNDDIPDSQTEVMDTENIINGDLGKRIDHEEGILEVEKSEKVIVVQQENSAKPKRLHNEKNLLTFEEFSEFFDLMANPTLCKIAQLTQDHCDVDPKFVQLIKDFNTF